VGDCSIEPQRNLIVRGGVPVRIEPKVMDLLLHLCSRAGDVVGKNELLETVWRGHFVSEHVLTHAVWQLRRALGDPELIESIPKRGYRVTAPVRGTGFDTSRQPAPAETVVRSIAVLPLANLSRDPEQEFFADGMTEALVLRLAQYKELRVVSRTSVMRYKHHRKPLRDVAKDLEVETVVEGSVFRDGDRVRISAELVDAAADTHLWAGSYERNLADVLQLQREVADAIAANVSHTITGALEPTRRTIVKPEAYEAYLRGLFCWYKYSAHNLDAALDYFQLAAERDPSFADPIAGMARVWFARENSGLVPASRAVPPARAAAERALSIDGGAADAHAALGLIRFHFDWDWRAAEYEFRTAIDLKRNDTDFRLFYADFLCSLGRSEEGLEQMKLGLSLDPVNYVSRCFLGWYLLFCRRVDEAIEQMQRVSRAEPAFGAAHQGLWGAYYLQGRWSDALREAQIFFRGEDTPGDDSAREVTESDYRRSMRHAAGRLIERSGAIYIPNLRIARLYAHGGDVERALHWLERACRDRESPLVHLKVAWDWDNLKAEPRHAAVLKEIGLTRAIG
jgi:TolB-like protein